MDIDLNGGKGQLLTRMAMARSSQAGRAVGALSLGAGRGSYFVRDELIIDAEDQELIDRAVAAGGRVVRENHDPEIDPSLRELGLGRDEPLDMTDVPRSVKLRFARPPDVSDVDLGSVMERASLETDLVTFSDPQSAALAAFAAPMLAEGRGIWLNEVGTDSSLPLRHPVEFGSIDSFSYAPFTGRSRIADAWQLIESLKLVRSTSSPIFIAIVDSGFWFDAPTTPGGPGEQVIADLGTGMPRWNLVEDEPAVPAGPGRTEWHGTLVASAAAAAIGNTRGVVGAGGSVARACYWYDDRSADAAKLAMIRATQWGIPFVVYAGGFTATEFFFGTSAWDRTFNWAADNGTMMFASAGNSNTLLPDDAVLRPATRTPRVLSIGATHPDGTKWDKSSYGTSVRLWAPGVGIPLVPAGPSSPVNGINANGTSYAAPIVAGVAAMMRYANPALTVDQIRDMLIDTGWEGEGKVTRGLDAYAAVWAAMSERMQENAYEAGPVQLVPRADGTFSPNFVHAINRSGDVDEFFIDVPAYSSLAVDVQWYERLGSLTVEIFGASGRVSATVTSGPGSFACSCLVGSGRYRIVVTGRAPTAYLLTGRVRDEVLGSDQFEGNDSFDTATRLQVVRPALAIESVFGRRRRRGPGTYDLTLTTQSGRVTRDVDFFEIFVPEGLGVISVPIVGVVSDEPVDLALFSQARGEIHSSRGLREEQLRLDPGTTYLRVSGPTHTRYRLTVGTRVNSVLERVFEEREIRILPPWWDDPRPDDLFDIDVLGGVRGVERGAVRDVVRGVVLDEQVLDDGELVFGGAASALELVGADGEVLRQSVADGDVQVLDIRGIEAGVYAVRSVGSVGSEVSGSSSLRWMPPRGMELRGYEPQG